jgi:hypothetical protein
MKGIKGEKQGSAVPRNTPQRRGKKPYFSCHILPLKKIYDERDEKWG